MTFELALALGGVVFGGGGAWAVSVFKTATLAEQAREDKAMLLARLDALVEKVDDLPTRNEHDDMKKQIGSLQSHLGDVREDVAELRGAASRR